MLVKLDMPVSHQFETLERELYLGNVLQALCGSWLKEGHVKGEFREIAGSAPAPGVEPVWRSVGFSSVAPTAPPSPTIASVLFTTGCSNSVFA